MLSLLLDEGMSEGVTMRSCNIPWLHNGHMSIMLFLV